MLRFSIPKALLYLPNFVFPHRLRQIRSLCIHWCIYPAYKLGRNYLSMDHRRILQVSTTWKDCWKVLSYMEGLHELYISFACSEDEKVRWLAMEARLLDGVKEVTVKKSFVIVLPFEESNLGLDVGQSRCELRVPYGSSGFLSYQQAS